MPGRPRTAAATSTLIALALAVAPQAAGVPNAAAVQGDLATARGLAYASAKLLGASPERALLLALEACRRACATYEVRDSLLTALQRVARLQAVLPLRGEPWAIAVGPDGRRLAVTTTTDSLSGQRRARRRRPRRGATPQPFVAQRDGRPRLHTRRPADRVGERRDRARARRRPVDAGGAAARPDRRGGDRRRPVPRRRRVRRAERGRQDRRGVRDARHVQRVAPRRPAPASRVPAVAVRGGRPGARRPHGGRVLTTRQSHALGSRARPGDRADPARDLRGPPRPSTVPHAGLQRGRPHAGIRHRVRRPALGRRAQRRAGKAAPGPACRRRPGARSGGQQARRGLGRRGVGLGPPPARRPGATCDGRPARRVRPARPHAARVVEVAIPDTPSR